METNNIDKKDLTCLAIRDAMAYCNILMNDSELKEEDRESFKTRKEVYKKFLSQVQGEQNDLQSNNSHSDEIRNFRIIVDINNSNGVNVQSVRCEPTTPTGTDFLRDRTIDNRDSKRKMPARKKTNLRSTKKSGLRRKNNSRKSDKV